MAAVEIRGLTKDYPVGFWRRAPKRALDGLSLGVESGEIFGLLGPNGAGKSTTLKILLRLLFPTSGTACVLGAPLDEVGVHARIGYLPENPHYYEHLTAAEYLNYTGELFGLSGAARNHRVAGMLEQVGLVSARNLRIGKFSKGMVQRLGIAQALINDPDLVFFDEPMSGLDPLGRREVRDLILRLRCEGKTVFFSTHILSDAETLCDRVAILNRGRLEGSGELRSLLSLEIAATDLVLEDPPALALDELRHYARSLVRTGARVRCELPAEVDVNRLLELAIRAGARVVSVNPVKVSLEDYFLSKVEGRNSKFENRNSKLENRNSEFGIRDSRIDVEALAVEANDSAHEIEQDVTGDRVSCGSPRAVDSSLPVEGSRFSIFDFRISNFQFPISRSLRTMASIALHTFKESVRDKVLYNLIAFALVLIAAAVLVGSISVGANELILINLSLSAISAIGLLMAIFIGIGLVSKEIERRTILNVLAKPVRRGEFIVGKFFGLLLTLGINTAIMTAGFYLALLYEKGRLDRGDLIPLEAVYFILLQLALVIGLALLFSCISTPILSAVYTFALFVIGNFLSDLRGFGQGSASPIVQGLTSALYYLLPNFSNFNVISQVAHGDAVPGYLLVSNSLYALLYGTILLSAAVLVFEEREFR